MTVIDPGKVALVYSGRAGSCCCGCAGKHRYASKQREAAGENRGYAVTDAEVSDRTVTSVLRKVCAAKEVMEGRGGRHFFSTIIGKRVYIVYLVSRGRA